MVYFIYFSDAVGINLSCPPHQMMAAISHVTVWRVSLSREHPFWYFLGITEGSNL
jgi:hypothetical protein